MSRIHDALRQTGKELVSSLLEVPGAPLPLASGGAVVGVTAEIQALAIVPPVRADELSREIAYPLIEQLRKGAAQPGWKLNPEYNAFAEPHRLCAEQFRKLRSRLDHIREMERGRTVLVTSAVPKEGKTFAALNLALAITRQHDRRVLLVDADLRMPKLHSCLHTRCLPGLSEYLLESAGEMAILQRDVEGDFFFIPSGNFVADPTELLGNGRFQVLLERLAPAFDWVIVDTPPVLPASDAGILSRFCDGMLMVVRAGSTDCGLVEAALKEVRASRLLGVVLNQADEEMAGSAYSYYPESQTEKG